MGCWFIIIQFGFRVTQFHTFPQKMWKSHDFVRHFKNFYYEGVIIFTKSFLKNSKSDVETFWERERQPFIFFGKNLKYYILKMDIKINIFKTRLSLSGALHINFDIFL